ncbi:hypothetical protein I3843_01G038900 [Carya illinoinensis]|nr:hypothetical protein I3843_01G038900 [Carya illinoinensis]
MVIHRTQSLSLQKRPVQKLVSSLSSVSPNHTNTSLLSHQIPIANPPIRLSQKSSCSSLSLIDLASPRWAPKLVSLSLIENVCFRSSTLPLSRLSLPITLKNLPLLSHQIPIDTSQPKSGVERC